MLQGGGGKTLFRAWEGYEKKVHLSPDFFTKILKRANFFTFSSKILKIFDVFAASGRGEP